MATLMAFAGSWAGIFTGIILFALWVLAETCYRDEIIEWEKQSWKKVCRVINRWIRKYERRRAR